MRRMIWVERTTWKRKGCGCLGVNLCVPIPSWTVDPASEETSGDMWRHWRAGPCRRSTLIWVEYRFLHYGRCNYTATRCPYSMPHTKPHYPSNSIKVPPSLPNPLVLLQPLRGERGRQPESEVLALVLEHAFEQQLRRRLDPAIPPMSFSRNSDLCRCVSLVSLVLVLVLALVIVL